MARSFSFMLTAHHYSYVSHAILNLGFFMDTVCIPCTYFVTFAYTHTTTLTHTYHKAKKSTPFEKKTR